MIFSPARPQLSSFNHGLLSGIEGVECFGPEGGGRCYRQHIKGGILFEKPSELHEFSFVGSTSILLKRPNNSKWAGSGIYKNSYDRIPGSHPLCP